MERPFKGFSVITKSKALLNWMPALTTALITTLFGQIYFRPFYNDFRFSLGVVAFALLLFMYDQDWKNVIFTALTVGLFRVLIAIDVGLSLQGAVFNHYPAVLYYIIYGFLFYKFNIKSKLEKPVLAVSSLIAIDVTANFIELVIRSEYNALTFTIKLQSILLYGLFRAFIILIVYFVISFYPELIFQRKQKRQYYQMIIDQSRLSNEVLFLSKSENEIEEAMSEAFQLYSWMKDVELTNDTPILEMYKQKALNLSRNIHDIKKDYKRIHAGLESMIPNMESLESYELKELLLVLSDDLIYQFKQQNKLIEVSIEGQIELPSEFIYTVIGIIGNLLVNAMEAFESKGQVLIELMATEGRVMIKVADNGPGMAEDQLSLIFNPGYSTKYDKQTGKMSTGMGLSQVEYLVNNVLKGEVKVNTKPNKGTSFTVTFLI